MKPLKVKRWYVETMYIYPSGLTGWNRWQEIGYRDYSDAVARRLAKVAAGEKREMRIVAIDFRGKVITPERMPKVVP